MAEVSRRFGLELMPWQRHVVDVAMEVDPDTGGLWYREVVLTVPRQSGKTSVGMAVKTHRCTRFGGRQNVVYTAQSRNAARKKWEDEHVYMLEHAGAFRGAFTVRRSNGSEAIMWRNGSKWSIDAPTEKAGHGETLDMGEVDEAFAHEDDRVEQAMSPAMITRPSPQIWVQSTAGTGRSFYLWRKVLGGREACATGQHGRTAYFEWSAPDDADPADEAAWLGCSPALGHTITIEALRAEWARAVRKGAEGVRMFRRAYLNQWPEVPVLDDMPGQWLVITQPAWLAVKDPESVVPDDAPVAFALDVSPDRAWSSIGLAGTTSAGAAHVEIVDHRPGTGWVVDRVADLVGRWGASAVALDSAGPVGSLLAELEARLPADLVVKATLRDHSHAAGAFADAVAYGSLRHRGSSELDAAVAGATKRPLGDSWAWARAGQAPICPLVAVTLALWAHRRPVAVAPKKPVFAF